MKFDAESAVLGAILLDPKAYWKIADILQAEDFSRGEFRRLWDTASALIKDESDADAVTIGECSPNLADLALELATNTPGTSNVRAYAEIVAARGLERRVMQAGQKIATLRGNDVFGEAQRILAACQSRSAGTAKLLKAHMREWFALVNERAQAPTITGIPTSIEFLDEILGGWQPGDLVILAARPSVGKTALGIQALLHAGESSHAGVLFSAEMSGAQVADRAVSNLGKISTALLRKPKSMVDEHWASITTGVARGSTLPVYVDDSAVSPDDICARTRQLDSQRKLGLVVIDYLTHLKLPKAERADLAIGEATRAFKRMAKDLQVPVLLLAQLNRDGANKRPTLNTLRGSGDIEQDADIVLFLHRPDESKREAIELIVAKHRNGACGECWLHADMDHMRFLPGFAPEEATEPPKKKSRGFEL